MELISQTYISRYVVDDLSDKQIDELCERVNDKFICKMQSRFGSLFSAPSHVHVTPGDKYLWVTFTYKLDCVAVELKKAFDNIEELRGKVSDATFGLLNTIQFVCSEDKYYLYKLGMGSKRLEDMIKSDEDNVVVTDFLHEYGIARSINWRSVTSDFLSAAELETTWATRKPRKKPMDRKSSKKDYFDRAAAT